MIRKISLITFLLSETILMTGCSDNGLLFRSVGSYEKFDGTGIYMIEKPYEINGIIYTPAENYDYFDSGDAFWFAPDKNHPLTANGERNDGTRFTAMHRTLPLPSIVRITNLNNHASVLVRVNDRGPNDSSRLIDVSQPVAEYLNFSKTTVTPVQVELMVAESRALKKQLQEKEKNKVVHHTTFKTQKTLNSGGETVINADDILYPGMSKQNIQQLKVSQTSRESKIESTSQNASTQTLLDDNEIIYSGVDEINYQQPNDYTHSSYSLPIESYYIQIGAFSQQSSIDKIKLNLMGYSNLFVQDKTTNGRTLHHVRVGPFGSYESAQKTLDKIHRSGYVESKIIQE